MLLKHFTFFIDSLQIYYGIRWIRQRHFCAKNDHDQEANEMNYEQNIMNPSYDKLVKAY